MSQEEQVPGVRCDHKVVKHKIVAITCIALRKNLVTGQRCSWVDCSFLAAPKLSFRTKHTRLQVIVEGIEPSTSSSQNWSSPTTITIISCQFLLIFFATKRKLCHFFKTLMSNCNCNSFRARFTQVYEVFDRKIWHDQCMFTLLQFFYTDDKTSFPILNRYTPLGD